MNIVALVGNVANDPELRHTSGGKAVCTFRLAVSRVGGEQADFFTVVCWERQAEVCKEYITLGRRVSIEGRLHHTVWESEGTKRSAVEVIAHRVGLVGPRRTSLPDTDEAIADQDEATDTSPVTGELEPAFA